MIEKIIYVCELCGGSYSDKKMAQACEESGYPKFYDKFINSWIIAPIQIMTEFETLESSIVNSKIMWFAARIEANKLLSPANYDVLNYLKLTPIAHSVKFTSLSFMNHFVLKQFLDYAIIVDDKDKDDFNKLLVENEICRAQNIDNFQIIEKVKDLITKVILEKNIELPSLEDVEKYEYQSSTRG